MPEPITMGIVWLGEILIGGYIYDQIKNKLGKDKFSEILRKAQKEVLKKEDNQIIWNKIYELKDTEIKNPEEFNYKKTCELLPKKYKKMCHTFFEDLEKEYSTQIRQLAAKDPVAKYVLNRQDELFTRVETLEGERKYSSYQLLKRRVEKAKEEIKTKKVPVTDFVGRKNIIDTFPDGNVFIQGKAQYGKTYVMLKLCSLVNGCYIPLDIVNETDVFEILVTDAEDKTKRLFIDDFQIASPEMKKYIKTYTQNVVIASQKRPTITKNFTLFTLGLLDKANIKEYFSLYEIGIDDEALEILKDDLNFPIKLRIFVNYLQSEKYEYIDKSVLKEIFNNLGFEQVQLPDKLEEYYQVFVFDRVEKNQIDLCYILSLLRFPASVGQLSCIAGIPAGDVEKLLQDLMGVLKVSEKRYTIFHDSFSEFCLKGLGDARGLHKKIGMYFEGLNDIEGRVEAMYHYRVSGEKKGFERVYDLSVVLSLIYIGGWDEAEKDFEMGVEVCEGKKKAESIRGLGTIYDRKGNWDKAMELYRDAKEIFEKLGDVHGLAQTYNNLGSVYADKGEWDTAIEYYEKSEKISEKLGDVYGIALIYSNIGLVYYRKGEWDLAIEYYEKSEEIKEKLGDVHGLAQTYNNLGSVYADKGEWDTAIEYYEKSEKISEKLGDVYGIALIYSNIANIHYSKMEFKKALSLYFESEKILKKLGDKFNLMKVYYNLTLCYKDMNQEEKAIEYLQKAEILRKELGIESK